MILLNQNIFMCAWESDNVNIWLIIQISYYFIVHAILLFQVHP